MKYFKEILVIEAIIFILFWINNEYIASLLTFIAVPIFIAVFVVSYIAEKIENSKVNKEYFYLIAGLALVPTIIFISVFLVNGGTSFDWANE
jgi:hypothetical protein